MTPARYVATLRERWHPDGYSDAEIATWLIGESEGLLEDLKEDFIRQPTCTAVQEVTRYADFLSACVCLLVAAQEHKLLGARTARFRAHTP